jgi:hypothetical protein
MLQRTGEAETITTHYLFALGAYRALYIPNWIYRYFFEVPRFWDPIAVIAGIVQTILYSDFFWIYYTKCVSISLAMISLLMRGQGYPRQEVQFAGVGDRVLVSCYCARAIREHRHGRWYLAGAPPVRILQLLSRCMIWDLWSKSKGAHVLRVLLCHTESAGVRGAWHMASVKDSSFEGRIECWACVRTPRPRKVDIPWPVVVFLLKGLRKLVLLKTCVS